MFIGKHLEGWDDVDFALSLHDYDLSVYQPHFPGYYLYVAMARTALILVNNDVAALALPNVIFGSLIVIPIYLLACRMFSKKTAITAAILYTVNPLCWLQSERPLPDISAAFFILLFAQLSYFSIINLKSSTKYMCLGGFVLGIALGIKPSYFPFLLTWFFILLLLFKGLNTDKPALNKKLTVKFLFFTFGSLATGISAWLVPLLTQVGINNFFSEGYKFTLGHFTDWGGTIQTESSLFNRVQDLYWNIFVNGLGFWRYGINLVNLIPTLTITVFSSIYGYTLAKSCKAGKNLNSYLTNISFLHKNLNFYFIIVFVLPYIIWMFIGQNLSSPRHAIPLIPIFLIIISAGLTMVNLGEKVKITTVSILFFCFSFISANSIIKFRSNLPAQIQFINYVKKNFNVNSTRIYSWESKRLFDYYAPTWDVRRVRNITDLEYDLKSSVVKPELILCTSRIEGLQSSINNLHILKKFKEHRYINDSHAWLDLYKLENPGW